MSLWPCRKEKLHVTGLLRYQPTQLTAIKNNIYYCQNNCSCTATKIWYDHFPLSSTNLSVLKVFCLSSQNNLQDCIQTPSLTKQYGVLSHLYNSVVILLAKIVTNCVKNQVSHPSTEIYLESCSWVSSRQRGSLKDHCLDK